MYIKPFFVSVKSKTLGHISGGIFNDLGLLFTQLQKYDKAKKCFEEALPLAQSSGEKKKEAVIRQNLGAAYNFIGEYQRAISFHKSAADMYGK
jgi:tetratricopeptide (TPR) repeat protein